MDLYNDVEKIKDIIEQEEIVLAYFTTTDCNLCKDLFPKIERMLEDYPKITGVKAESDIDQRIVGEYKVFMVPTVILFIQGKETIRLSRNISIPELRSKIDRYCEMLS
jgi:thioredoxin-like negative regulator of GroEL